MPASHAYVPKAQATRDFFRYLDMHPAVCKGIRARPGKTILYAGLNSMTIGCRLTGDLKWAQPTWQEINKLKKQDPMYADKQTLHDVLSELPAPNTGYRSLLQRVEEAEKGITVELSASGAAADIDAIWRRLSGHFAANAEGAVSFHLGRESHVPNKVFVSTEMDAVLANPKVDATTKDAIEYYRICIAKGEPFGLNLIRA